MRAVRARVGFDGEAYLPDGVTVIIDGDRIAGVEPYGASLPVGCPVDDHDGLLLPGLVDTHTHLVGDSGPDALDRVAGFTDADLDTVITTALADQLRGGVTTVRDLGDRRFAVVDRRHRPGEPHVVAAGPPITSVGGHCFYMGGEVAGRAAIEAAVAERVGRGVDVIKVMASGGMTTAGTDQLGCQFSDDELRLIVELAHRAGLPVTAHAHALVAVRQAVAAGVDGIEHCTCLTERGPVIDPELFDDVAARGIAVCATVGGDVEELDVAAHVQVLMARMGTSLGQVVEHQSAVLAALHRAGATIVGGIDSGINHTKAHGSLGQGMAAQLRAGLPAGVVLAGVTGVAARVCGVADRKGRLVVGYDADLVVLGADPRRDLAGLTNVRAVVLSGEPVA